MSEAQHLIGKPLTGPQERDAVHIAVAAVIAFERLYPGQRIGFYDSNRELVASHPIDGIGIVDPFLSRYVEAGERFFIFMYPNSITSLRHAWSHPAFGEETTRAEKKR